VGVQFRNCATVGGTIWGRFGFSDPLTCLLTLDVDVVLYKAGAVPLSQFVTMPRDKDILTHIVLHKTGRRVVYQFMRNAATDFPVLAVAVSQGEDGYRCAVGARPAKAALVTGQTLEEITQKAAELTYATNTRGSEEYRRYLSGVLIRRCVRQLEGMQEVEKC
jgi:CO/xanthine dehydrogenase FAD-binding subunit